jgi:hypothetical protein
VRGAGARFCELSYFNLKKLATRFSAYHRDQNGSGAHPASSPMGTRGSFPGGVKLTTYLHLVQRSRMSGAIPPFPQYIFMAWCLVKHRDNFTFYFTFTVLDNSNTRINSSNPIRHMVGCQRFFVLCYPMYADALARIDPSSKEAYRIFKRSILSDLIVN